MTAWRFMHAKRWTCGGHAKLFGLATSCRGQIARDSAAHSLSDPSACVRLCVYKRQGDTDVSHHSRLPYELGDDPGRPLGRGFGPPLRLTLVGAER